MAENWKCKHCNEDFPSRGEARAHRCEGYVEAAKNPMYSEAMMVQDFTMTETPDPEVTVTALAPADELTVDLTPPPHEHKHNHKKGKDY